MIQSFGNMESGVASLRQIDRNAEAEDGIQWLEVSACLSGSRRDCQECSLPGYDPRIRCIHLAQQWWSFPWFVKDPRYSRGLFFSSSSKSINVPHTWNIPRFTRSYRYRAIHGRSDLFSQICNTGSTFGYWVRNWNCMDPRCISPSSPNITKFRDGPTILTNGQEIAGYSS